MLLPWDDKFLLKFIILKDKKIVTEVLKWTAFSIADVKNKSFYLF